MLGRWSQSSIRPDLQLEAMEQLRLRYRLAAAAADTYVELGDYRTIAAHIWLDTTAMTPDEAVDDIQARTMRGPSFSGPAADPPEGV